MWCKRRWCVVFLVFGALSENTNVCYISNNGKNMIMKSLEYGTTTKYSAKWLGYKILKWKFWFFNGCKHMPKLNWNVLGAYILHGADWLRYATSSSSSSYSHSFNWNSGQMRKKSKCNTQSEEKAACTRIQNDHLKYFDLMGFMAKTHVFNYQWIFKCMRQYAACLHL